METNIKTLLTLFLTLSYLSATEILNNISVEDAILKPSLMLIEEESQINTQTLSDKLFNSTIVSQAQDATSANLISVRGNNYRATEYYEDGVPLYRTSSGFTDLSMYRANDTEIMLNGGAHKGFTLQVLRAARFYFSLKRFKVVYMPRPKQHSLQMSDMQMQWSHKKRVTGIIN